MAPKSPTTFFIYKKEHILG